MGVPQHFIIVMCNLCSGQEVRVRTEYGETFLFPIDKGCILFPYLFNVYTEHITQKVGLDSDEE